MQRVLTLQQWGNGFIGRCLGMDFLPLLQGSAIPTCRTVSASGILLLFGLTECLHVLLLNVCVFHKVKLVFQVRKLKMQLEEERQKYSKSDGMNSDIVGLENGSDLQLIEMQSTYTVTIQRYSYWGDEAGYLFLCCYTG